MKMILRLQGLDNEASTEDIRSFFEGIHIPDGGVFIVGGAFAEAFIAFSSEADGLLAINRSGNFLKNSVVALHISSMVELVLKLATLFRRKKSSSILTNEEGKKIPVEMRPTDPRTANRRSSATRQLGGGIGEQTLNINLLDSKTACTSLHALPSSETKMDTCDSPNVSSSADVAPIPGAGYIRVFGLPLSITKSDICHFFKGLNVQEVILNVHLGVSHGSLVKFNTCQDACDALSFNLCSMGSACVEVRAATEKMWVSALEECKDVWNETDKFKQSPLKDTVNYIQESNEWARKRKCNMDSSHQSKKIKKCQATTALSESMQYIVMISYLPVNITKTEIKQLVGCPNIAHKYILHLLDTKRNRTDKAFVMFDRLSDYDYAIHLSGCHMGSHTIDVSPITKEEMKTMMRTIGNTEARQQRLKTKEKDPHWKRQLDAS